MAANDLYLVREKSGGGYEFISSSPLAVSSGRLICNLVYTIAAPTIGDTSGGLGFASGSTYFAANSVSHAAIYYNGLVISNGLAIGFATAGADSGHSETGWYRVSNGVIAQRALAGGGGVAQTYQIYGAYTDSSNYVRLSLITTSTTLTISGETAGTGEDNLDITLTPAGTGGVILSSIKTVTKTANYTATSSDCVILCDTTSSAFTITLPTAVNAIGRKYIIKDWKGTSATFNLTIATTSNQTIDGTTTKVINNAYNSITVISDGANWSII